MYHKTGIDNNFKLFARGAGDENIMTMLMIFLLAGAFSSVAGAIGRSIVNSKSWTRDYST